jgi:hypothetical protein
VVDGRSEREGAREEGEDGRCLVPDAGPAVHARVISVFQSRVMAGVMYHYTSRRRPLFLIEWPPTPLRLLRWFNAGVYVHRKGAESGSATEPVLFERERRGSHSLFRSLGGLLEIGQLISLLVRQRLAQRTCQSRVYAASAGRRPVGDARKAKISAQLWATHRCQTHPKSMDSQR